MLTNYVNRGILVYMFIHNKFQYNNTYYHTDTYQLPDLEEVFKGKPHLEVLLKRKHFVLILFEMISAICYLV